MSKVDIDGDGVVSKNEKELVALENADEKANIQKLIAIYAFVGIVVVTIISLTPIVPLDRIETLSNVIEMFYISCAGIVAAFFGSEAFVNRR